MNTITKSMQKAGACEIYYAAHYLEPASPIRQIEAAAGLAKTGTDVHRFLAEYVNHLVDVNGRNDGAWGLAWLGRNGVTEEAAEMIRHELKDFSIDPDTVLGTEVYMSVDAQARPIEWRQGAKPGGQQPHHPDALAAGTLDCIYIVGTHATIDDYKSGWSTNVMSDFEPPLYAALVMAHFSQVETVEYRWIFPRVHAQKSVSYRREDMEWIVPRIRSERAALLSIEQRYRAGEKLRIDPWAGLCQFCGLKCPLREVTVKGASLLIPPLQTEADAREAAALLYAAEIVRLKALESLKPWLDQNGPLSLNDDFICEASSSSTAKYPLPSVLHVLGIDINFEKSPSWDVPLASLTVSGSSLKGFAKAKKRQGLGEELLAVAKRSARTQIRVRRRHEAEQLTEGGDDE